MDDHASSVRVTVYSAGTLAPAIRKTVAFQRRNQLSDWGIPKEAARVGGDHEVND